MTNAPSKSSSLARWAKLILVLLAFGSGIWLLTITHFRERSQALALQAADQFGDRVRPMIKADPRFAGVRISTNSANGWHVYIYGGVSSSDDLAALHHLIESQSPPTDLRIAWGVMTDPYETATKP